MTSRPLSVIGFVVLNYGPPEMALKACLSIAKNVSQYLVVLVDNFSSDENRKACQKGLEGLKLKNCQLLMMPDNRGYGAGMNAGLKTVFECKEVAIAFVSNSDVVLQQFWSIEWVEDREILVAATLNDNGKQRVGATGFWPLLCLRRTVRQGDMLGGAGYVEGCFLGMTRPFFMRTRGFSEEYFLYFEELDLSYKYRDLTGRFPEVIHVPGIVVEHMHGGVTGMRPGKDRSTLAEYWSARSRMYFFLKWNPWLLCSAVIYNVLLMLRCITWLRFDLASAVLRGTRDAFLNRVRCTHGRSAG